MVWLLAAMCRLPECRAAVILDAAAQGLLRQHHIPMALDMASDDEAAEPQPEEVRHAIAAVESSMLPTSHNMPHACAQRCSHLLMAVIHACAGHAAELPAC